MAEMINFNLANPYQAQLDALARRQQMAEILAQQAYQPMQAPGTYNGIQAPISHLSGLAKILEGYTAGKEERAIKEERKALGERYRQEGMDDITRFAEMAGRPAVAAVPGSAAFTPMGSDYEDRGNAPVFNLDKQGMVPAVDPVAARIRGQIDPSMIGQFKTPEMQRMALAAMLKQGELPAAFNLGAEETRFQPPVGGGAPVVVARGVAKPVPPPPSPFAQINPKDFTQASLAAAMKPDGTIDRTLLVAVTAAPTGNLAELAAENADRKQKGLPPLSISQYREKIASAGRPLAAPRERTVFDTTRGGTVNLDTQEFTPVVQKGVPIGGRERPLTTGEVEKITSIDNAFGTQKRLADTFEDSYGGYTLKAGGELANIIGGKFGGDNQAQSEWWASHDANDNVARNALFGASLTAGEQKAWEKTSINPGMSPSMIRNRMTERQNLIEAKRKTTIGNLESAGYDVKGFKNPTNFYESPKTPIIRARNPTTGEEIISTDGGNNWQPARR